MVLTFPSLVDHILSELSTMTCPTRVAIHDMAHNFIELDKAVIHVINEISSPIEIFRLMKLCVCVCVYSTYCVV